MRTIGVVGAGIMGSGIAQVIAANGMQAIVNDVAQEFLDRGISAIRSNLDRAVQKGRLSRQEAEEALSRVRPTLRLEDMAEAEFVIEAATEREDIKLELFRRLDQICAPEVILATNTSSIPITRIAAATKRPERVVGMHFFNPPPVMRLVEVIRGIATDERTVRQTVELARALGKEPVEVADAPGFVVNRLLIPMINEAAFLLQEGVARAEDIDRAMKLGANHPMGPLELADLIGLDTVLAIMEVLERGTGDPKYRPCPLLRRYVEAGRLGRKSGQGFYRY